MTVSEDPCGHEWPTAVSNRTRLGSNCPSCAGKTLHYKGLNSMRETHPRLAESFHPTKNHPKTPDNILAGHGKRLWWQCPDCDHEWDSTGTARKNHDSGCPYCVSAYLHSDGRNSLAKNNPELSEDWDYEKNEGTPDTVTFGSRKTVWWKCKNCDHEWPAQIAERNAGKGCGPCNRGDLHSTKNNSLAAMRPDLASQLHPNKNPDFSPHEVTIGHRRPKVWWLCSECGHEWKTTVDSRVRGSGCDPCNRGGLRSDRSNSLSAVRPDIAEEWHPELNFNLTPESVTIGSNEEIWWKCKSCSHDWRTPVYSRGGRMGTGCPACSISGYNPSKIGYLYILHYSDGDQDWLKCGITNDPELRFQRLSSSALKLGIETNEIDIYRFDDGAIPKNCERELLEMAEIRFDPDYDIEGKNEFFKYEALETIRKFIEKW